MTKLNELKYFILNTQTMAEQGECLMLNVTDILNEIERLQASTLTNEKVDMVSVLTTGGKREDFHKVRVDTFETIEEAQAYINEINKYKEDKYWYRADIIEQGKYYEPDQEGLN